MIPAGPERDKVIAEMRGDKAGLCEDGGLNEYYDGYICDCGYKGEWGDYPEHDIPVKPYSTDIAYAMELWEEMKKVGDVELDFKIRQGNCYCRLGIGGEPSDDYDIEIVNIVETEADAISGAWLKWREGE